MTKAEDYRKHAAECRALARSAPKEDERKQLLKMADAWISLAEERDLSKTKHPELARWAEQDAAEREAVRSSPPILRLVR